MKYSWLRYMDGGGMERDNEMDGGSGEEVKENLVPPRDVSEHFRDCVDSLKWSLYESVVLRPELNTPEAQKNELLQTYEVLLEKLHAFLSHVLKGPVQESALQAFPEELRDVVLKCAHRIQGMRQGGGELAQYTDRIPYHDYLETQLRTYPYLQYHGKEQDE